jgi:Flp pilus assembly protein TadD
LIDSHRHKFHRRFYPDSNMKKNHPLKSYKIILVSSVLMALFFWPSLLQAQQAVEAPSKDFETTMAIGTNEFLDPAAQSPQQSGQALPPAGQPITPLPVVAVDQALPRPAQTVLPSASMPVPIGTPPSGVVSSPTASKVPTIDPPSLTMVQPLPRSPTQVTAQSDQIVTDATATPSAPAPVDTSADSIDSNEASTPVISTPSETQLPSTVDIPPASEFGSDQGIAQGGTATGDTGTQVEQHSGQYYDSLSVVPDGELARAGITSTRKVDPKFEPGQRFVVVEKSAAASSYEALYVSATRALKLGRYAAAMEMFQTLHSKNRRDVRVLMGLAIAQQGAGFLQSAIETYEDILKLQPDNASAIINLMGLMKDQFPAVTLERLSELRRKYPNNPGVPAQMGHVNAELKQYDNAMRFFEVAASMEPRNPDHIFNMAIIADRKGDVSNAIKLYERALELDASFGSGIKSLSREQIYDRLVVLRRKT